MTRRTRLLSLAAVGLLVLCAKPSGFAFDIEMVDVAAGTFRMGDPWAEGNADELPVHDVTVDPAFRIGRYEITNGEYALALNWAQQTWMLIPPEERITNASGAAYDGGDVYVNGQLALALSDPACQIYYGPGIPYQMFLIKTRDAIPMNDHPTVMVTWWGALAFCNWQSRRESLPPAYDLTGFQTNDSSALSFDRTSAVGYRLPTEAEWELAAAWDVSRADPVAGGHWRFGFQSDTASFAWANYYDGIEFNNPHSLTTAPYTSRVGFFDGLNTGQHGLTANASSALECYDMSGNVAEWCQDWYHANYSGAPTDGRAWEVPEGTERVLRGGDWTDLAIDIRSAARLSDNPSSALSPGIYGFRVAMNSATVEATPTPTPTLIPTPTPTPTPMPIDISLVRVPAGSFRMGDPWTEGDPDERPVHTVRFARDYLIGEYEITNRQFADRMTWAYQNPASVGSEEMITNSSGGTYTGGPVYVNGRLAIDVDDADDWCQIRFTGTQFVVQMRDAQSMDNHPVVMVTFYGALAFCNWQSRFDGLEPAYDLNGFHSSSPSALSFDPSATAGYRLPSESQWERAAAWDPSHGHWRYGFTADAIDLSRANYYDNVSHTYSNPQSLTTGPLTSRVGFFDGINTGSHGLTNNASSALGCYDMSGNVYEWCQDNQDSYLSDYTGAPTDGSPWETSATGSRIWRGGSWNTSAHDCRSSYRSSSSPINRDYEIGFRVARSTDDVTTPPTEARDWILYE